MSTVRLSLRDGSRGQKTLLGVFVLTYALGVVVATGDILPRVGRPSIGWVLDGDYVFAIHRDAFPPELLGGGRLKRLNGYEPPGEWRPASLHGRLRTAPGEVNELTLEAPGGRRMQVTVPVRALEWRDVVFADGTFFGLGLLFFLVALSAFALRPYAPESWALMVFGSITGGLLTNFTIGIDSGPISALYFRALIGLLVFVPFHLGLAFPVAHPLLVRRRKAVLLTIYGLGAAHAGLQYHAWRTGWAGALRYLGELETSILLVSLVFFLGRCALLAVRADDRLVRQRARVLLFGTAFGAAPFAVFNFVRNTLTVLVVDMRVAWFCLAVFLVSVAWVTVKAELFNARVAARRAVVYGAALLVLTGAAVLLTTVRPYAVSLLLLPLLYVWPSLAQRLDRWLYPDRARYPERVRLLAAELTGAGDLETILSTLARALLLCGSVGAVAFVLPGEAGDEGAVAAWGEGRPLPPRVLAREPLVQLLITVRRELLRSAVAVEPQYANIRAECAACFERLGAELLVPLVERQRVIGGLAVGFRRTADPYEQPEVEAFIALALQSVQAVRRVQAMERLRARELEFADLKRFFPPQIIEQVMARGGAAELRSRRKRVTVVFVDLRGFTAFSETADPEEVSGTLAEYHSTMGRRVAEWSGTLERFAGDGFMVFFNDPVEQPDHAARAAAMALAMREDVAQLRQAWHRRGYRIDFGMGIETGYATCGFIGYEGRRDYGVIGNVTNLAARLSDAASPGDILVGARARAELEPEFDLELVGELTLKGFHQPQPGFRLLGRKREPHPRLTAGVAEQ